MCVQHPLTLRVIAVGTLLCGSRSYKTEKGSESIPLTPAYQ